MNEDAKAALIQRIGQEVQDLTVMTKLSGNPKIVKIRTSPFQQRRIFKKLFVYN